MNLWVKKYKGQLALLAVALFFFGCVDESSILGYKNPPKFNVHYIEIPLTSSTLLYDSVRTSNNTYTSEPSRMLVGSMVDPKFGTITSSAYTQYFTVSSQKIDTGTVYYDSVVLELKFDLYTYAPDEIVKDQTIAIHEVDEEMTNIRLIRENPAVNKDYYRNTEVAVKPTPLATKTFSLDNKKLREFSEDTEKSDTVIRLRMKLDPEFGSRIFESAKTYRDAESTADSAFVKYPEFIKTLKGIAIKPVDCNKMFGFSQDSYSRISIYYHTDKRDSIYFSLTFTATTAYNQISADRSSSDISEITQKYQDYTPLTNNNYIQSATGIYTKLDFSNYYAFADTIPNLVINSAEIVVGGVEPGGFLKPPKFLVLRALKPNNREYKFSELNSQSILDFGFHRRFLYYESLGSPFGVAVDRDSTFIAVNDAQSAYLTFSYDEDEHTYSTFSTMLLQQLFYKYEGKTRIKSFALYPVSPPYNKAINRAVFPRDNIKLKIYYTRPIKENL